MAFLELHCYSKALVHQVAINVLLPQWHPWQKPLEGPRRTLYLLHGMGDDHTGFQRRTSLERYLDEQNVAVIMPSTMRGFWTDMSGGGPRYWTFVSEELPELMESLLGVAPCRETTFAAGMSFGGYGALKLGFRRPERFRAVAAMSAAPMSAMLAKELPKQAENEELVALIRRVFGETIRPEDDIFKMALAAQSLEGPKPDIYMCCGTDDFIYQSNQNLADYLKQLGRAVTWREHPGEKHTWQYWDQCLPEIIEWVMGFETL